MPYIDVTSRKAIENGTKGVATPGELNYLFTRFILEYIEHKGLSYQTINDVLGALDGCSKEFYRRIAVPYEDRKIQVNGDVYHE